MLKMLINKYFKDRRDLFGLILGFPLLLLVVGRHEMDERPSYINYKCCVLKQQ